MILNVHQLVSGHQLGENTRDQRSLEARKARGESEQLVHEGRRSENGARPSTCSSTATAAAARGTPATPSRAAAGLPVYLAEQGVDVERQLSDKLVRLVQRLQLGLGAFLVAVDL